MEANAFVAAQLIVSIEVRGPVVGCQQNVQIAIVVEVSDGKSAAHLGLFESAADFRGRVIESSLALIYKQLGRLGVTDVAANVAHSFIDVTVGDRDVEQSVQIGIKENTTEAQGVSRGQTQPCF